MHESPDPRRPLARIIATIGVPLLLIALTGFTSPSEPTSSTDEPTIPRSEAPIEPCKSVTRQPLDSIMAEGRGRVAVPVGDNDVSMLLTFVLPNPTDTIGITRITSPDGQLVHSTHFASDSWEATAFSSRIVPESIVGTGDLALFIPESARLPLSPGLWHVSFETDPPDSRPTRIEHVAVRHLSDDTRVSDATNDVTDSFDASSRSFDLHVHALHSDPAFRGTRLQQTVDEYWRTAIDRVLGPHALSLGSVIVSEAPARVVRRLSRLDDETEITAACRATRKAAGDDTLRLHVGLVRDIVDARTDDWTTGLSPQPGSPYDARSPNACAFIATDAWRDEDDPETAAALLAANLLHELGHFAGLVHPSEADGKTFDLLDDTPRCTARDAAECGIIGGADNVMFHSGDATHLPYYFSPDQARVLRRHPLFRVADY